LDNSDRNYKDYYYILPGFTSEIAEFMNGGAANYNPTDYLILETNDFWVHLRQISWTEMSMIEKSSFMDDMQEIYFYNRNPFYITFHYFKKSTEQEFSDSFDQDRKICDHIVKLFMCSLYTASPHIDITSPLDYVIYGRCYPLNIRHNSVRGREAYGYPLSQSISRDDLAYFVVPLFRFLFSEWSNIPEIIKVSFDILMTYYNQKTYKSSSLFLLCIYELLSCTNAENDQFKETEVWKQYKVIRNNLAHGRGCDSNSQQLLEEQVNSLICKSILTFKKCESITEQAITDSWCSNIISNTDIKSMLQSAIKEFV